MKKNVQAESTNAKPQTNVTPNVSKPLAFAFQKENYILMLVGIGIILLGYFIMSADKEEFGFGFLGLTLGPVVLFLGFMFEFFAIFYTKKKD